MNVRDETRHEIHKSAAPRYALLCIVTRLISDVHFHITGPKLTFNSKENEKAFLTDEDALVKRMHCNLIRMKTRKPT